jgi:hypothetical protein
MQHVNMENAGLEVRQMPVVRVGDGEFDHLRQTGSLGAADVATRYSPMTGTPGPSDGTD